MTNDKRCSQCGLSVMTNYDFAYDMLGRLTLSDQAGEKGIISALLSITDAINDLKPRREDDMQARMGYIW